MPNLDPILTFLSELSQNNNKAWFDSHRSDYDAARRTFEQFVDGLIDAFRTSDDLQGLAAKNCMARINRDVRFSKDKSPYKTNFGAIIAPGGWKAMGNGYYLHLAPQDQSMVAGGWYDPTPEQLNRFRQAVDQDAAALKTILNAPAFVEAFQTIDGERLKTAPKGYDRAHPDIDLLQLKQITVIRRFSDQAVTGPAFTEQVISTCQAIRPFLNYLDGIVR
jgi:uncharacterized protein (TIGR02453 family)